MRNLMTAYALLALILIGPVAASAADLYECRIDQNSANGGWIPAQVVVNHNAAKREVIVFDTVIKAFAGAPLIGRIETENNKRITFNWRLKGTEDSLGQDAEIVYRLTVLRADLSASMTAQALNYDGPYAAQGTCTRTDG